MAVSSSVITGDTKDFYFMLFGDKILEKKTEYITVRKAALCIEEVCGRGPGQ